ncbi:hypothetical protein DQ04_17051010 [Trypanosoma grayi]|uniref:hypothetical protein n=1 Tax=Trypanosoma grayi TaxID=71804 RepID=UPI0004F45F25|nr:hypothetical protein DQ04_17051010 [Trypanosoma grayi]KEG05952.1 hypothetical protein DQ04_17051010 [Trypanosoma grayi]
MVCSVTPEQELHIIKTILTLRSLGDAEASERLRGKVRRCLLDAADDDAAVATAEQLLRRYTKLVKKLDGTYEKERELKRRRSEQGALRASRYVDDQAESGDEDEDADEDEVGEEEEKDEREDGKKA